MFVLPFNAFKAFSAELWWLKSLISGAHQKATTLSLWQSVRLQLTGAIVQEKETLLKSMKMRQNKAMGKACREFENVLFNCNGGSGAGHICVSSLEFCHDGSHQLSQEAKLTLGREGAADRWLRLNRSFFDGSSSTTKQSLENHRSHEVTWLPGCAFDLRRASLIKHNP